MQGSLQSQRKDEEVKRKLVDSFVELDQAYRDFATEITVSRFSHADVRELVHLLKGVLRSLICFASNTGITDAVAAEALSTASESTRVNISEETDATKLVMNTILPPTRDLFWSMEQCIMRCDIIIMDLSGYRKHTTPLDHLFTDLEDAISHLRCTMKAFDIAEGQLMERIRPYRKRTYAQEVVKLFVFCYPVREAAATFEAFSVKINEMKRCQSYLPHVHWPSHPLQDGLATTNAQVRHDQGGDIACKFLAPVISPHSFSLTTRFLL